MQAPTRADYVRAYFTLFEYFQQERGKVTQRGHPFEYADQVLIVFFSMMIARRITAFKAQHRWLMQHLHEAIPLGFEQIPHRITLSRRYKTLLCWMDPFISLVDLPTLIIPLKHEMRQNSLGTLLPV